MANHSTGLQLRSTVKKEGVLELTLVNTPTPDPKPDEVVVRVDASPINPSDLGLLFGAADMTHREASGTADESGRHREHRAERAADDGRPSRSIAAGRQRRRRRRRRRGFGRSRAETDRQNRRDSRRRDVFAVPRDQGRAVSAVAAGHDRHETAPRVSSIR